MYNPVHWEDNVSKLDSKNLGNMDYGIADVATALQILAVNGYLPLKREFDDHKENVNDQLADISLALKENILTAAQAYRQTENLTPDIYEVTLYNDKNFPFNSTMTNPTTIALKRNMSSLDYKVEVECVNKKNGGFLEAHVEGKALNGFKIWFEGSAKEVTLKCRVSDI